jgi:hypothetical protein
MDANYFRDLLAPKTKSAAMLKTRSAYLAQLYRELDTKATDLSFLNDTRSVLRVIRSSDNVNTQKTRIFHVMSLLKLPEAKKLVLKKNITTYENEAGRLRETGNAIYQDNVMNETQKQRYMSLNGLSRSLEQAIIDLYNKYFLKRTATMSKEEFDRINIEDTRKDNLYTFARDLQQLVIFACYTWQPALRNDYGTMEITKKAIGLSNAQNWLQLRKNGSIFLHLNLFKNRKSFGKQVIEIKSDKLKWLLRYWVDLLSRLVDKPKRMVYYSISANHTIKLNEDPRTLGRQIPRISEKICGKPLSINDLRHIWEMHLQSTEEYKRATQAEREKMHKQLLHGYAMAHQYNLQRRDDHIIEA